MALGRPKNGDIEENDSNDVKTPGDFNSIEEYTKYIMGLFSSYGEESYDEDDIEDDVEEDDVDFGDEDTDDSDDLDDDSVEEKEIDSNKIEDKLNNNIHILLNPNYVGTVNHVNKEDLLTEFLDMFGSLDIKFTELKSKVKLLKDIDAWLRVDSLEYLTSSSGLILFKTKMIDERYAPFAVAAYLRLDGTFELDVIRYGNTINADGRAFSKDNDPEMFDSDGNFIPEIDIDKQLSAFNIMGIDEGKRLYFTPRDFGIIFKTESSEFDYNYTNRLFIGKIKSNETSDAVTFKSDYNLKESRTIFDFYVKLKEGPLPHVYKVLKQFIRTISPSNPIFNNSELKVDNRGALYIDLDLTRFTDGILESIGRL